MLGLFENFTTVKTHVPQHPAKIILKDGKTPETLKSLIDKFCPKFKENYFVKLSPLLFNSHLQVVHSQLADSSKLPIHYERRELTYPDKGRGCIDLVDTETSLKDLAGEKIDFDYKDHEDVGEEKRDANGHLLSLPLPLNTRYVSDNKKFDARLASDKPIFLMLHGLSGGSQELYVKLQIRQMLETLGDKFDIMVLNSRGCSNCIASTPRLYNGFWTDDVRYLINEVILPMNRDKKIYMMGFSLGASVLTNFLGQESVSNEAMVKKNIKLGIAISTPWDFYLSTLFLHSSYLGREIYSPAMADGLRKILVNNYVQVKENPFIDTKVLEEFCFGPNKSKTVKTLYDFDEQFTSKFFKLGNAETYYKLASPTWRLPRIKVPFVIVNAIDDPVVGPHVPKTQVAQNPYTHMITTSYGSHVAWFEWSGRQWYNEPVAQLVQAFENVERVEAEEQDLDIYFKEDRIVAPDSYSDLLNKKGL